MSLARQAVEKCTGVPLSYALDLDELHLQGDPQEARSGLASISSTVDERGLSQFEEICYSTHLLEEVLGDARTMLHVTSDFMLVKPESGKTVSLQRQPSRRGMLRAMAKSQRPLSVEELFRAGWPEQTIDPDSAARRVYTNIYQLRKQGLHDLIQHEGDGYALRADLIVDDPTRFRA
jgi:hypothetical protein